MQDVTQINPNLNCNTLLVGRERTPVIIFDDVLVYAKEIASYVAGNAPFQKDDGFYPGQQSTMLAPHIQALLKLAVPKIVKEYAVPSGKSVVVDSAFYSFISTPEKDLVPQQCRPHRDGEFSLRFAVMQYLGQGEFGGTGFFRHKPTGFEKVTESRREEYVKALTIHERAEAENEPRYFTRSVEQFELIADVEYRPNRVVVYPGNLLHSGLITPGRDVQVRPELARLTANVFVGFTDHK